MSGRSRAGWPATIRATGPLLSRIAAAILGGYALSWSVAALLAATLPATLALDRVEAVLIGGLAAFPIHVGAAIWCFASTSAARAWAGLTPALPLTGLAFLLVPAGS
ncbi:DUF3649 domain-containing protein [Marivibrio halodurans]|uniref:DUF3649 domain-containing protein n=1 Tax=Marivibrio halodurans TaxID=2039722 RepID=A0A8J7SJZ9_9PROT|nr:DUF3649 domain-containing protein [Marivibrio halodurans]MBP5855903.1 DUF3649 domain-containing protein [Marivibrio halodurans]